MPILKTIQMEFCEMKNKNKTTSTVNNIKNSITCTEWNVTANGST